MKVAVIFGGKSSEREVSINTKDAVMQALQELNIDSVALELDKHLVDKLQKHKIDVVFNAGHGSYCEDGKLPGLLDIIEIPYTHSGLNSSQIGMNKVVSKEVANLLGIKQPEYSLVEDFADIPPHAVRIMKKPFVIKPVNEGSSVGVYIFQDPSTFTPEDEYFKYGPLLVEEYVKGQEVHAVILDNQAIGAVEIKPQSEFYDYGAKYTSGDTEYTIPPQIPADIYNTLLGEAEIFHNFIGCNYISRVDFIVRGEEVFFLEINTHPGFTKTSLVPKVAESKNISFKNIVKDLIDSARYEK